MQKLVLRCVTFLLSLASAWTIVQARSDPTPLYSLAYATGVWSSAQGVNVMTLYDDGSSHVETIDHAYYGQGDVFLIKPWWSPDGHTVYLPIDTGTADQSLVTRIDAYEVTTHTTRTLAKLEPYNQQIEVIALESVSPDGRYVWVNTMTDSRLLDLKTGKWLAHTSCPSDTMGWVGNRTVLFEVMGCSSHFLVFEVPSGQLVRTIPLDTDDYEYYYQWQVVNAAKPYLVGIGYDTSRPAVKLDLDTGTITRLDPGTVQTPTATPQITPPNDCAQGCDISYAPGNQTLAILRTATTPQRVELYTAAGQVWTGAYTPIAKSESLGAIGWSANGRWLFLNGMGLAVEVATGHTVQVPGVYNFINTSSDDRWWVVNTAAVAADDSHKVKATLYDSKTGKQIMLLESDALPEANFHWAPSDFYLWSPLFR